MNPYTIMNPHHFDFSNEGQPRTLYVGNLDHTVTEPLITALFSTLGEITACKLINEANTDPYCFIEYREHNSAAQALLAMNKRVIFEKEIKVNWASSPGHAPKQDTSKHHHIFVGDLSPEIETSLLREAFNPYGEISDCRVVKDPQSLKSKGYGFVSFVRKSDAETAINAMSGQWLGGRAIRTNWATRKPPSLQRHVEYVDKQLSFENIYQQASEVNSTVYCGGIIGFSEERIHELFNQFGNIVDVRLFKDKGYAFIKFDKKNAAAKAIHGLQNKEIDGQFIKCSWGKETKDASQTPQMPPFNGNQAQPPMNYPQPAYWFPSQSGYVPSQNVSLPYHYGVMSMPMAGPPNYYGHQQQQQQQPPANFGNESYSYQDYNNYS